MPYMNLRLNAAAWRTLDKLAKKSGKTKAEVLRNALVLIDVVQEQKEKKKSLAFVDNETEEVSAKLIDIF